MAVYCSILDIVAVYMQHIAFLIDLLIILYVSSTCLSDNYILFFIGISFFNNQLAMNMYWFNGHMGVKNS